MLSRARAGDWRRGARLLSSAGKVAHKLPELKYGFAELEPAISGKIMEIHYSKHHNAYVTNLNVALGQYAEAETKGDMAKMIALQSAIKFNGGGHVNHTLFWENLAPKGKGGGGEPTGELGAAIKAKVSAAELSCRSCRSCRCATAPVSCRRRPADWNPRALIEMLCSLARSLRRFDAPWRSLGALS